MNRAGKWVYKAGAAGTVTLPAGATLLQLVAHSAAGGSFTIFGGDSVPVPAGAPGVTLRFDHELATSQTGSTDIVFTTTDSYLVEYHLVGSK